MASPQRKSARRPPAFQPLHVIVQEHRQWLQAQPGKVGKGALRQYWQQKDRQHGPRPDYQLWRQTQCPEAPPDRRLDSMSLAEQGLRSPEPDIQWAVLAMAPELPRPVSPPKGLKPLSSAPQTCAAIRWLVTPNAGLDQLESIFRASAPAWKPGKAPDFSFIEQEGWLPVYGAKFVRWMASAVAHRAGTDPAWLLTGWLMRRDQRRPGAPVKPDELELLVRAGQAARLAGDHPGAVRLLALFVHLLPRDAPAALVQRARVAAWFLRENGIDAPAELSASLADPPFPGESPESEKGREAAMFYHDKEDAWHARLRAEAADGGDWQRLAAAGVALHHPAGALAWIGKKAQAYAVKRQTEVLEAALALALKHHLLGVSGRILAHLASSPERVVAYARELRESIRQMPFLRSSEAWSECAANLRLAWGRLEANSISDLELLFFIHETLTDREVTTLRSLPLDTRLLALRHLHTRRTPSALVQAMEADPRLPLQLEHQRTVEWWSISSLLRERADLAKTAWVSLVRRGDPESGKYSLIIQTGDKRLQSQDRVKGDWSSVVGEIAGACKEAEYIFVATDAELPRLDRASYIPSWEWAFRVLREPVPAAPSRVDVLRPEGSSAEPPAGTTGADCVLAGGDTAVDANTVWTSIQTGERVRSLGIGAHPRVASMAPVRKGTLKEDLVRLCLAQATGRFVICDSIICGVPW